ncbi:MAG: hypothetical protein ACI4SJ_01290, partial [Candidatus Avispirillum sp.]
MRWAKFSHFHGIPKAARKSVRLRLICPLPCYKIGLMQQIFAYEPIFYIPEEKTWQSEQTTE